MAIKDLLNHTTEHHTHAPAPTPTLGVNQVPGIDYNHPLFLSPSDVSEIQIISFQLAGIENYSIWFISMRIALLGRNILGLIDGSCTKIFFPEIMWNYWKRVNAIVLSWIMNSVASGLLGEIMYASSTQDVWNDLYERFNKIDGARSFNLHKEIATLSQGTASVFVYFSKLKDLWEEFEALVPSPSYDCEKSKEFVVHLQELKPFQFLMGLNDSYSQARSQILLMSPMPNVNQTTRNAFGQFTGSIDTVNQSMGQNMSNQLNMQGTSKYFKDWIIDTGATNHMVADMYLLDKSTIVQTQYPKRVFMPNGGVTHVTHTKASTLASRNTITNVFYISQFKFNLLLVSKLTKELRCLVAFFPDFCIFQELFTGKVKAISKEDHGLYILRSQAAGNISEVTLTTIESSASYDFSSAGDIDLWHKRFGHVSTNVLRKLLPIKLELIAEKVNKCAVCQCAMQTRQTFHTSCIKITSSFDLVHVDLWGPYKVATFDGNKYFLTMVDDFSRTTWLFLLKLKSDVCIILQQFIMLVRTQFNKTIKVIRTDNGTEFVNTTCNNMFNNLGIIHQTTCAYTPQ
ncbi:uncharacterized protein LOC142166938 [Nicotiana tabacum]|uniref:Uncharacterized protein LOC142166938 n=1 Tax=Nicotiana tabacum TaxID=4097 RepID=A0AC58SD78_TOBAC